MTVIVMGERDGELRALNKPGGKVCPHLKFEGPKASCAVHERPEFKHSPCWVYGNPDADPDFAAPNPCKVGAMFQERGGLPVVDAEILTETIELDELADLGPWPK